MEEGGESINSILPTEIVEIILSNLDELSRIPSHFVCKEGHHLRKQLTKPNSIVGKQKRFVVTLAERGERSLLEWAIENGCEITVDTCADAARYGHFELLKWLVEEVLPNQSSAPTSAKEIIQLNHTLAEVLGAAAAKGEHKEILFWLSARKGHWEFIEKVLEEKGPILNLRRRHVHMRQRAGNSKY